jgi:hypothetical protein
MKGNGCGPIRGVALNFGRIDKEDETLLLGQPEGRATAQAVSRWLPTAAAWVQTRV